jgi:5-methylcytosine-specific restriction endonuclease McrA
MPSKKQIQDSWEEAKSVRGRNPENWRKDIKGRRIRKGSYGTLGKFGWEVDHKFPKSKGGSNRDKNLQPLHWKSNRKKSDNV